MEVFYTFALVFVVLNVATEKNTDGNSYFGLAIGFTVMAGSWSIGSISGCAMNPAVGTGLMAIDGDAEKLWIYWVGPLLGAVLASLVFRVTSWDEFEPTAILDVQSKYAPSSELELELESSELETSTILVYTGEIDGHKTYREEIQKTPAKPRKRRMSKQITSSGSTILKKVNVQFSIVAPFVMEFIGTFFLVLTVALNAGSDNTFAPLAIGGMLMVLVFAGGHVSGAHYNPAVTLGVLLRGRIDVQPAAGYVVVQVIAGLIAAAIAQAVTGESPAPAPGATYSDETALLMEVFYTFALVFVVLNVATEKNTDGNSYFGLAIGFTVMAGSWSIGSISGCAMNPAVGTGLMAIDGDAEKLWIYWVGPLLGAVLASLVFRVTSWDEFKACDTYSNVLGNLSVATYPVKIIPSGADSSVSFDTTDDTQTLQ